MIANRVAGMLPALKRSSDLRGHNVDGAGGRDLFVTQRGGTGALADWTGSSEQLRRMQVHYTAWFAVHVMSSMNLAGLDRTYGTLGEEVDRILRASEESPPSTNIVIDFALMRKIREASTSALQLEVDSAAPRISTICPEVLGATTEVLRSFLTSKKLPATPAFEVILGVTDPDDRLRALGRRIGDSDRIVTASLATYLALTLCDPYAYGMSPTRSMHAFLASTIARAKMRSEGTADEAEWELTELDHQIMLAPEILSAGDDDADPQTLQAALAAIKGMPAFKAFMACALRHRATKAHETNPKFHGMYTILKATYIVHVAVTWLQKVLMAQMKLEETGEEQPEEARAAPHVVLTPDAAHLLEYQIHELERIDDRHLQRGDLSGAYIALAKSADAIRRQSLTSVITPSLHFSDVVVPKRNKTDYEAKGNDAPIDEAENGRPENLIALVAAGKFTLAYPATLALPGEGIRSGSAGVTPRLASEIVAGSSADEMRVLVKRLVQYAKTLRALAADAQTAPPPVSECGAGCTEQRMYKLATPLMILGRTFAFMHKLYAATGTNAPNAKIPVIVTMIRKAGWSSTDKVANMRYTASFAKQFAAFTMTMGHGLLYCHETTADSTRGLQFGMAMQKLRDANLTLMAMVQRRVLDSTEECHPFRHGALTQLTLPAATVARMLPSDRVLPLDWDTASKLQLDRDSTLRALLGNGTFSRLREEDTATLGLLRVLSKNAELAGAQNEVIKRMKALAFSGRK